MFKISQNLLVFSKNNILSFYDTKTQKQLADYEYSGKIPDSGPVPKKNKPCESRVDNLDILYVDLTPSSDCESAKVVVAFNDKTAKYLNFSENNITVVKEWNLAKRPTSIKILESKSGDIDVVVCDKTGDVYPGMVRYSDTIKYRDIIVNTIQIFHRLYRKTSSFSSVFRRVKMSGSFAMIFWRGILESKILSSKIIWKLHKNLGFISK